MVTFDTLENEVKSSLEKNDVSEELFGFLNNPDGRGVTKIFLWQLECFDQRFVGAFRKNLDIPGLGKHCLLDLYLDVKTLYQRFSPLKPVAPLLLQSL